MELVNLVNENGKEEPMMIFKPYIYATVYDCHVCYAVVKGEEIKIVEKKKGGKK